MSSSNAYIVVHGGAGRHSRAHESEVRQALKMACKAALGSHLFSVSTSNTAIQEDVRGVTGISAHLDMVETAISVLEDDPSLNAGYGSNLTLNGTVECDAAIMDGRSSDFGSVGAVSGIKNPIRLARSIIEYSKVPDKIGRIPPLTLVSDGAREFSKMHAPTVENIPSESLISPRAAGEFKKWKGNMETSTGEGAIAKIQDTVGAVAWHKDRIAAGVSSGGILLKSPGRIGEAAIFGAGCWAQHYMGHKIGMGCSVSGTGEHIIRSMLARAIGDAVHSYISKGVDLDIHDILQQVLEYSFWQRCRERGIQDPAAGVVLLMTGIDNEGNCDARLWCAFTTPSMAIGYASLRNPEARALVLRRPESKAPYNGDKSRIFITAISLGS